MLRMPKLHQGTMRTPVVERRPASGAEPAGRREAMPTPDADSTFPESGAGAPQRRRPAASPQPVHKPQLEGMPTPSSSEFTTGPCRSLAGDCRNFGMDTLLAPSDSSDRSDRSDGGSHAKCPRRLSFGLPAN